MKERLIDLIAAIVVLVAGVVLTALGERELGGVAVTASVGYIIGSYREKPGGLDEAVRVGAADLQYMDTEGDAS